MKKTRKTERQSGERQERQERQKDNVAKSKEDREINSEFKGRKKQNSRNTERK